jgi:integrase/recombinase XerD
LSLKHISHKRGESSLVLLFETLESEYTKRYYTHFLNKFSKHIGKNFDDILLMDKSEINQAVQTFIIEIKKEVNPNSIPTIIAPIRSFLEVNEIVLNWRLMRRFYPRRAKVSGASAWSTEDIQKMLETTTSQQNKTIIHMLASTGCRIGGLEKLQLKHVRDVEHGCKMVTIYPDDFEEYYSFLTPEAAMVYDSYLKLRESKGELLNEESFVFKPKKISKHQTGGYLNRFAMSNVVRRAVERAGLRGAMWNKRYATQACHGFRKRFNTILKSTVVMGEGVEVEKMMGHFTIKFKQDTSYFQFDKMLDAFVSGIADLTISDDHRLRYENKELIKKSQSNTAEIAKQVQKYLNDMGGNFSIGNQESFNRLEVQE